MITDIRSEELTNVGTCGAYVAEASEFGNRFDPARGLTVRAGNGNRVAYHVAHVEVDPEGDVRWWDLLAPGYPSITIFND